MWRSWRRRGVRCRARRRRRCGGCTGWGSRFRCSITSGSAGSWWAISARGWRGCGRGSGWSRTGYALARWSWRRGGDLARHLARLALMLALGGTAQLIRIMRANLLDELRRPYVVTARAKGLSERRVILKYPVRAALNPFASTIAYLFPYLVSGSVIISIVLRDRKSTRLNSSHANISYAVFCLKKKSKDTAVSHAP